MERSTPKFVIVYGTRPEAIKLAPLILEMPKSIVVNTGQHKNLTHEIRKAFKFKDNYRLHIMRKRQTLEEITRRCLKGITKILQKEKPDAIIVHGDTTTAMASALAAYYLKIKIIHIEAGLRTGDIYQPFPEEINRTIIDSVADYAFCPTRENIGNITNPKSKVYITGNTVLDALRLTLESSEKFNSSFDDYILVTSHRKENIGKPLEDICEALKILSKKISIVFIVHPNPEVKKIVDRLRNEKDIYLSDPLSYQEMIYTMKHAKLILTDSGGIQEEAPSLKVPVLVLRNKTERIEVEKLGMIKLIGTDTKDIIKNVNHLLDDESEYRKMIGINPYGDGYTSKKIVEILKKEFS